MLIWCIYTYVMMTGASRAAMEFQTLWQRTSQLATLCCVCNRREGWVMREQRGTCHEGAERNVPCGSREEWVMREQGGVGHERAGRSGS